MTAPARPQTVVDTVNTNIAEDRNRVTELVSAYRDITGRLADPIAAYAAVAGAAYQSMCSRQATQVLAAAVQVIVEMQDAAGEKADQEEDDEPFDCAPECRHHEPQAGEPDRVTAKAQFEAAVEYAQRHGINVPPSWTEAVRAGVDRHWGPLAATGGELP